jgi:hypothetical protein
MPTDGKGVAQLIYKLGELKRFAEAVLFIHEGLVGFRHLIFVRLDVECWYFNFLLLTENPISLATYLLM